MELSTARVLLNDRTNPVEAVSEEGIQVKLTRNLEEAGKLFSVRALDHVNIGKDHNYSFADGGDLTLFNP